MHFDDEKCFCLGFDVSHDPFFYSAVIVEVGVSGGVVFDVEIDIYNPYPEREDGLVLPFELLSIRYASVFALFIIIMRPVVSAYKSVFILSSTYSLLPTNWFEVRLVITVFIEFFVRVGFKLPLVGFVELYSRTDRFEVVVFDEKYTPQPFPEVGSLDVGTGVLTLDRNPPSHQVIYCESREILPEGGETM